VASLIVAGTDKFPPLRNVLCALTRKNHITLNSIYLIDTPETIKKSPFIIEDIKKTLGNQNIYVSSIDVDENNAADIIPDFMGRFIIRDTQQIRDLVIDLTTGPKYVTSLLYATANFCRMDNIHYFLLKSKRREVPFEELNDNEYEYLHLPLFSSKSLDRLRRRSHLDLIYYLKDVEDLVKAFMPISPRLADEVDQNMRLAVLDYFNESYKNVIEKVAYLFEVWNNRIFEKIGTQNVIDTYSSDNKFHRMVLPADKFNNHCDVFRKLKEIQVNEMPKYFTSEQFIDYTPLAMVGEMENLVLRYRDMVSHIIYNGYKIEREDAKIVLDIGFAFVNKCKQTDFVWRLEEN